MSANHPTFAPTSSIPPGLGYLALIDELVVNQQIDIMDMFTGWETKNRYVVSNRVGQQVYFAVEENDFFTMNFLGASRPFDMLIMDNLRVPVLRIHRPYQLEGCGCCGFVQQIEVTTGTGQLLGTVSEVWHLCAKKFRVQNATGQVVFLIEGPVCTFDYIDIDFDVLTADNSTKVGAITRKFPGLMLEMMTHSDIFGVRFPMDLDVAMKAVLLAATFLIDFMYYEKQSSETNLQNSNDQPGKAFGTGTASGAMMMGSSKCSRPSGQSLGNNQSGFTNDGFSKGPSPMGRRSDFGDPLRF